MVYHLRRTLIALVFFVLSYIALSALYSHLDPSTSKSEEEREDNVWIATSKYWVDRQACRWLGLCGLAHYRPDPATKPWNRRSLAKDTTDQIFLGGGGTHAEYVDWEDIIDDGRQSPDEWEGDPRVLKDVPQFVLDHAPMVHLYSGEQFWPSDINEHLMYTTPYINHTTMNMTNDQHTLYNLQRINQKVKGKYSFMASKVDVEDRPEWLGSPYNKPVPFDDDDGEVEEVEEYEFSEASEPKDEDIEWWDPHRYAEENKIALPLSPSAPQSRPELRRRRDTGPSSRKAQASNLGPTMPKPGGYSPAPAVLVMVDKGNGILDAFWFYFYSYNLGTTVLNIRFGNHVGDWEHSLVRFHHGVPKAVFFSAHSGGLAYSYNAVEKGKGKGREGRPILYSALGSHAMYASPGSHPYVLPFGLLADVTDKGPLWDPALNYMAFHFNTSITHNADAHSISASGSSPATPPSPINITMSHVPNEKESTFQPASCNPKAPLSWWWYNGHWGDKFYDLGDRRQWRFAGQYHYVNGPFGPRYKNLGRSKLCQSSGPCRIVESLKEGSKKSWLGTK
jgi:hypothetical protein